MSSNSQSVVDGKPDVRANATLQGHCWTINSPEQPQDICNFETILLAIAGHDLRQSLQIVQGAHDLLKGGSRTSSELRHLRMGQKAIDQLNEQLTQLLMALRMRLHAKRIELRPVHVQQLLTQACQENDDAALERGISLRVVPSKTLIMSDSLLLGAALRNLVSNAVRYSAVESRILVGCRRRGSGVRIDIHDSGVGIPEEQMSSIFEPFTCLDSGRSDSLGIGLFIVRHAVGLLGYKVEVASIPARGSRFSIFVPSTNGVLEQPVIASATR